MEFNGPCAIQSAGINSDDGLVHLTLKAVDSSFDWTPFIVKAEQSREILAVALAAIASNKTVWLKTRNTAPWSEIWWFDIVK